MRERVGHGIFGWEGNERRSNRYGAVHLADAPCEGPDRVIVMHDEEALKRFGGRRVRLTCKVIQSRKSQHLGDQGLKIRPTQPEVGEEIDLGVGTLSVEQGYDGTPDIVLRPGDGRRTLWMDPRKLYRLHDQTVEVYLEETADAFHERPTIIVNDDAEAFDNGDGSYQVKNTQEGDRILPRVERLGDGLFLLNPQPGVGERLEVLKRRR